MSTSPGWYIPCNGSRPRWVLAVANDHVIYGTGGISPRVPSKDIRALGQIGKGRESEREMSDVGSFAAENRAHCTPGKALNARESSMFRTGDALLESPIAVTEAHVRHAVDEADHDYAMWWLGHLRAQRRIAVDNEIQDQLHERLDAQRIHEGKTLAQFLEGQK